jgi:putative SOS response-associated peptidase YedK
MPLILAPGDHTRWLSDEPDPHDLLRPFPAEPVRMWAHVIEARHIKSRKRNPIKTTSSA